MVTLGKEARGVGDTIWTAPHLGVPKCLWHLFTRISADPLSGAAGGWGGMEGADLPLQQHAAESGAENRTTLGCRGRVAGGTARDRRAPPATGLALGPGRTASGGDAHTGGRHVRCPGVHPPAQARG